MWDGRPITLYYSSIDGFSERREYKTLAGAQARAQYWIGEHPDLGAYYAVSFDGVGKIEVEGVSLRDLFPERKVS
jgi:hypothetical protein